MDTQYCGPLFTEVTIIGEDCTRLVRASWFILDILKDPELRCHGDRKGLVQHIDCE